MIDATAESFNIDSVNQEFIAAFCQRFEYVATDNQVCEFLPAIRYHEIISVAFAATEIEHQPFASDRIDQFFQSVLIQRAVAEHPGSNDHV